MDTDEDGNRMSILPDKSRPASSSKKDTSENIKPKSVKSKVPKKFDAPKEGEELEVQPAPKTALDRIKQDIKI